MELLRIIWDGICFLVMVYILYFIICSIITSLVYFFYIGKEQRQAKSSSKEKDKENE